MLEPAEQSDSRERAALEKIVEDVNQMLWEALNPLYQHEKGNAIIFYISKDDTRQVDDDAEPVRMVMAGKVSPAGMMLIHEAMGELVNEFTRDAVKQMVSDMIKRN